MLDDAGLRKLLIFGCRLRLVQCQHGSLTRTSATDLPLYDRILARMVEDMTASLVKRDQHELWMLRRLS